MAAPLGISVSSAAVMAASPTWTRLDTSYNVTGFTIDRGRAFELDKTGTGTATINLVDKTGAFDPTGTPVVDVMYHAALALQNPVTATWSTLFRGYVSRVEWVPYQTTAFANVRLELVDLLAILAATEMVPDGTFGDAVVQGDIRYNADTGTDAVQTRINKVLTELGFPVNSIGSDGVTNGTTTFTAASASFATTVVGKFIKIAGKGVFKVTARASSTSISIDGTPSAGVSLAWSVGMRSIFTGNAKLRGGPLAGNGASRYAPRTSALTVINEAADAEQPAAANFYIDKDGRPTFRGRLARFNPTNVDYEIQTWQLGDDTAANASPSTVVPVAPPLVISRDDANLYTSAIASPEAIADGDIPGQYVTNPSGLSNYGYRTWSAESLQNGGSAGPTDANTDTLHMAQYVTDNYASPRTRVGAITVKPHVPAGPHGSAAWALICGVDISDRVGITTTHVGGGGFNGTADYFFVEGVHYDVKPGAGSYWLPTLTLDVSPAGYYATNPF